MLLLMCRKNLPVLSDLPYEINIQIILGGMTFKDYRVTSSVEFVPRR